MPFEMTNKILWDLLADFVLVTDEEINDAIRLLAKHAKQVAEGAGAASLAAAIKLRDQDEWGSSPTVREGSRFDGTLGLSHFWGQFHGLC